MNGPSGLDGFCSYLKCTMNGQHVLIAAKERKEMLADNVPNSVFLKINK